MYLREFTQEGIVDAAVIFHDRLNPNLWDEDRLKPIVRYKLLEIAKHFADFINIPSIRLKDVTISGSNAAFTYTEHSDIDLHLVVSIPRASEYHLKPLFDAKKNQYNYTYDIKIKGIDVELYVQPDTDEHHSAGIYSVLDDKWISEPTEVKVNIDDNDVEIKVKSYFNKIKQALRSDDVEEATKIKDEINKLRKTGLEREGEFSVENIAFKVLRSKGYIDRLRQHIYDLEERELSLENLTSEQVKESGIDSEFHFILKPEKQVLVAYPKGSNIKDNSNMAGQFPYDIIDPSDPKKIEAADIIVYPEYRGRGLATAMYKKMRELGFRVYRSSHQTDAGKGMWSSFSQKGLEKHGEFVGNKE